jgi:hypothetical protein
MVSCVTQNFQVIDSVSSNAKPPVYRKKGKINPKLDINSINNLETPITKFSAKPSMLLPKSVVKIEQSPLDFFQTYNDKVYEILMKTKRKNLIAKYNAAQTVGSLKSDSFVHSTNGSAFSDKLCSPYEDERLNSFINSITNKRRKSALGIYNNRSLKHEVTTYENITSQKPVYPTSKASSPALIITSADNNTIIYNENQVTKLYPRSQTAMDDTKYIKNQADIKRPITVQGTNKENEIAHQRMYSLVKYMKSPKRDFVEPNDSVGNIKLFSENFIRILKSKGSTDVDLDNNKADCIDSYQLSNILKTRWKVNQDTLNELDDEEIAEMELLEIDRMNRMNDLKKPTPTPELFNFGDNRRKKRNSKSQLSVKINSSPNKSSNLSGKCFFFFEKQKLTRFEK